MSLAADGEIFDMAEVRELEGRSLLSQLLRNRTPLPSRAGVEVMASNIRRLSLDVRDPERLAAALLASRKTLEAFRQKRKPLLVRDVFVGKLAFKIMMEPAEDAQFQSAMEGFALDASEPDQVSLISEKEVPFAFRASTIKFARPIRPK